MADGTGSAGGRGGGGSMIDEGDRRTRDGRCGEARGPARACIFLCGTDILANDETNIVESSRVEERAFMVYCKDSTSVSQIVYIL